MARERSSIQYPALIPRAAPPWVVWAAVGEERKKLKDGRRLKMRAKRTSTFFNPIRLQVGLI
jgi:hypothetical protein